MMGRKTIAPATTKEGGGGGLFIPLFLMSMSSSYSFPTPQTTPYTFPPNQKIKNGEKKVKKKKEEEE